MDNTNMIERQLVEMRNEILKISERLNSVHIDIGVMMSEHKSEVKRLDKSIEDNDKFREKVERDLERLNDATSNNGEFRIWAKVIGVSITVTSVALAIFTNLSKIIGG